MSNNVLIVEDEALVALELRENIERLGHEVVDVADTAEQAVSLALTNRPDLILMDVRLNGRMDGIEAASLIRKSADIPIVFLTAYSGEETISRATDTAPYGYLLKPVQEQQLAGAINVAMHRHQHDAKMRECFKNASTILRALPNAVVVTSNSLDVRYMNSSAEDLLEAKSRDVVGMPLSEVVDLADSRLDPDSLVGFDEVLSDGRSVMLGVYSLNRRDKDPLPIQIEVSPLVEKNGVIIGALVNLIEIQDDLDAAAIEDINIDEIDDGDPLIKEKGDLRSYLEVEIVRLSMNNLEVSGGSSVGSRIFNEGQVAACKRVLRFMFGEEALNDIEMILPSSNTDSSSPATGN